MEKKTDVRSRYTQGIIKQAYLELLQTKSPKNITVAEICKITEINRGTFYNHFVDIQDVQEHIEDELFAQVEKALNENDASALNLDFYLNAIEIITNNRVLFASVFSNIQGNMFFQKLIDYSKKKYIHDFIASFPDVPQNEIDAMFTYVLHGSLGLISEWFLKNDGSNPNDIAKSICDFNNTIITALKKQ